MDETFRDALSAFRQFLTENGYPSEMIWIKPEDIIPSRGSFVFVRVSTSKKNEESARKLFDLGISRQYGVLFQAIGEVGNASCCHVWIPQNERESEEALMPRGIKMSARPGDSKLQGKAVRHPLHWLYLMVRYRKTRRSRDLLFFL